MADYRQVLDLARQLSAEQRVRLARELGGGVATPLPQLGMAANRPAAPQSVAWLKAERGHAVLATDTGPADADLPAGAAAIAGMWAERGAEGAGS